MIHELKILPEFFEPVSNEYKTFELRKNDRDYKTGDILVLNEWDVEGYTGRSVTRRVEYIYEGDGSYGLKKGYCILGLSVWDGLNLENYNPK